MLPQEAPLAPIEIQSAELRRYLAAERAQMPARPRRRPWSAWMRALRLPPPLPATLPSRGYLRRDQ